MTFFKILLFVKNDLWPRYRRIVSHTCIGCMLSASVFLPQRWWLHKMLILKENAKNNPLGLLLQSTVKEHSRFIKVFHVFCGEPVWNALWRYDFEQRAVGFLNHNQVKISNRHVYVTRDWRRFWQSPHVVFHGHQAQRNQILTHVYIVLDIEFQCDILLKHFIYFKNLRVKGTKKFSINWNFETKTTWDTRNYTCVKIDCLKQTFSQRLGHDLKNDVLGRNTWYVDYDVNPYFLFCYFSI